MKKVGSVLWGIVLIAAGVIWALNEFNITNINVFFDGWWTLFIIVPCAIGLFTEREKTGNIIGIAVGVFVLSGHSQLLYAVEAACPRNHCNHRSEDGACGIIWQQGK